MDDKPNAFVDVTKQESELLLRCLLETLQRTPSSVPIRRDLEALHEKLSVRVPYNSRFYTFEVAVKWFLAHSGDNDPMPKRLSLSIDHYNLGGAVIAYFEGFDNEALDAAIAMFG